MTESAPRTRSRAARASSRIGRIIRRLLQGLGAAVLAALVLPTLLILPLRWLDPPTTSLQAQRRIAALVAWRAYDKRMEWRDHAAISPRLRRAVLAAEDGRFYQHWGVDIVEAARAIEEGQDGERARGASTITMQLAKNLFLWEGWTLYDKGLRKGIELYLTIWLELLLPKDRILEIYVNVIEWGDGIYGAEAAAQKWYRVPASRLSWGQAARLAAVLPSPLRHNPVDGSRFTERRAGRILARL